jgi:predicted DNA-binding protein
MTFSAPKAEKITVTIPYELKEQLYTLKNEFNTTMSAIYKEALKAYVQQK